MGLIFIERYLEADTNYPKHRFFKSMPLGLYLFLINFVKETPKSIQFIFSP